MDKDTLRAIEIINEILGELERNLEVNAYFQTTKNFIKPRRQKLDKIINDNKGEQ